jgi:hypothetical protein
MRRQNASRLDSVVAGQVWEMMPIAIRYSLSAIRPQADATQ